VPPVAAPALLTLRQIGDAQDSLFGDQELAADDSRHPSQQAKVSPEDLETAVIIGTR